MVDPARSRAVPAALAAAVALAACKGAPVTTGEAQPVAAEATDAGRDAGRDAGAAIRGAAPARERFAQEIRPLLSRHGCDATPCHGAFKGGGFYLPGGADTRDYPQVVAQIDPARPAESKLWKKAVGLAPHNGGRNLDPDACDARRLLAWIGGDAEPSCSDPPAARASNLPRFERAVAPALVALGCAKAACHQGNGAARAKLDLAALGTTGPSTPEPGSGAARYQAALASFEKTRLNTVVPWKSAVLMAAWGEGARGHVKVDLASCAYRRLHAFVARAPEVGCESDVRAGGLGGSPMVTGARLDELVHTVMPSLLKRGCAGGTCHGGGAGGMSLFDPANDPHAGVHDYVMLTARMDPREPLDRTTLLRKARNVDAHGGGQRLGGESDCRDAMLVAWASGQPVRPCAPRAAPSLDRFAREVQPVLEQMTCTRAACHGLGRRVYKVAPHPDASTLEANYRETLAQIDPDFAPLSEVMLRMREPCAYAVVTAWIEGAERPACVVHDPDPGIFPRLDDPEATHP